MGKEAIKLTEKVDATKAQNIEALADAVEIYGSGAVVQHVIGGHSGDGWYVWSDDVPEEGSTCLGNNDEVLGKVFAEIAKRLADARGELEEAK